MKNIIIIVAVFILAASAAAGGMYWWQQRSFQRQLSGIQNQLSESEALRVKAESEKLDLERQNCKGTWENNACVAPQYSVHVISPNGGEVLCAGQPFDIRWESKGLKVINVFMTINGSNLPHYRIGSGGFPSNFNEEGKEGSGVFRWTVGDQNGSALPSWIDPTGYTYQVMVTGTPPGSPTPQYSDTSDNVFSIQNCKG